MAHTVANDARNCNGGGKNREQLLQSKDDQLTELRSVINLVDKIHTGNLPFFIWRVLDK